ncbi:MAG: sigma-70 family RNA polymerase sigma factor [Candidatus Omnitrophica bacterium]|nr:sigma-70 family RNA polymerase sigma factor [Candidatus Omnitrophota bacterium]MCM8769569.1 sigma-70 family RNA polymerase sigma factor [Candidatus Omnitrophota bacterium]
MPDSQKQERFTEIFRKEGGKVYALAYRLSGNEADARDVVQEVFTKLYQHLDRFEGRSQLFTYLYRMTFNVWCNLVRQKKRSRWPSPAEPKVLGRLDPRDSSEELLKKEERVQYVRQALEKLSPQEKLIIVLRDIEERSYQEIASVLKCRLGTVKSRLARARGRLRQILEPYLD